MEGGDDCDKSVSVLSNGLCHLVEESWSESRWIPGARLDKRTRESVSQVPDHC